jgi:hypothetical protein
MTWRNKVAVINSALPPPIVAVPERLIFLSTSGSAAESSEPLGSTGTSTSSLFTGTGTGTGAGSVEPNTQKNSTRMTRRPCRIRVTCAVVLALPRRAR